MAEDGGVTGNFAARKNVVAAKFPRIYVIME